MPSPISASIFWLLQPKQDLQLDFLIILIFWSYIEAPFPQQHRQILQAKL